MGKLTAADLVHSTRRGICSFLWFGAALVVLLRGVCQYISLPSNQIRPRPPVIGNTAMHATTATSPLAWMKSTEPEEEPIADVPPFTQYVFLGVFVLSGSWLQFCLSIFGSVVCITFLTRMIYN